MRRRAFRKAAALTAALMLSTWVASASASKLSFSNTNFRVTFSWLEFRFPRIGSSVRCNVTFEGSLHSATITKTPGSLIGSVTRANASRPTCTGGSVTLNQEALPWHLRFRAWRGAFLPFITGVDMELVGLKYEAESGGLLCTSTTTARSPATAIAELSETGTITNFRFDESVVIPLRGSFLCEIAGEASFAGNGVFTLLGNTNAVRITLI